MRLHALWAAHRRPGPGGAPAPLPPRFLCGGRLHAPHERSCGSALLLALAAVSAAYAALAALAPLHAGAAAAGLAAAGATWGALLWVVLCDPGVLPRHVTSLCAALAAQGEALGGVRQLARTSAGAETVFCLHCRVWRPPGAHHCAQCGWCVQQLSHHCAVLGVCIGARSRSAFAALQALLPGTLAYMAGHAGAALALGGGAAATAAAALTLAAAAPALAGALALVCGARVAGHPAAGAAAPCLLPPRSLVDFSAPAAPLEAAVAQACDEAWVAAAAAAAAARSRQGDSGADCAYLPPPAGSWEEACTEAMIECLEGTGRLALARAVAGHAAVARAAPAGVVVGWDLWPLPGGPGGKGGASA